MSARHGFVSSILQSAGDGLQGIRWNRLASIPIITQSIGSFSGTAVTPSSNGLGQGSEFVVRLALPGEQLRQGAG
jgi:hypothetical protein